ncbi:MAG: tagatose-bisphosphate aldolase [Candidatus Taylorbacteria bacterium CG10_big_fil_rev_8_21_14_0_10_41_48]|uniref:Tagatose-bisphosphate aldolase n=1 Tax=Candidatus Taylorbacteria bacterium CG10_big_fil_rev_8_21_14_0_10_41_48 TaxID=1975024 RepID=A0A2M8LCD9_9BACT|nr:MAG: tagatose-bisphosphate aldolase [Candidatus Taylorbacteria bacterium CG10_big_fil_rev_8_21_14_0_10_41_48]
MKTLREYVHEAMEKKVAIGHFNISNTEAFWGVVRAAKTLDVPVIIGVSEGERDFIGVAQAKALVESVRATGQPVFLNADHTYSFDRIKEVVDARYHSVIYDGTEQSYDDNVSSTKKCVEYAHSVDPEMLVEAEIGFIGKSSKVLSTIPEGVNITEEFLTKPEEAKQFVEATGADMLAPAVGNIHGMLSGGKNPALNIKRIKEIFDAVRIPLVLHGGSGTSAEDFQAAIDAGVAIVHINTEIRVAYVNALKRSLQDNPDEIAPYKVLKPAVLAVEKVVTDKLKIFNKLN